MDRDDLMKIPKVEHLLDDDDNKAAVFGLVDILFSYVYNHRSTEGENTVESGWTVVKLSGTLSWLHSYNSICEVIVSCYRRSLTFPLYRNWRLCNKVYRDLRKIFQLGRKQILKCLLETRRLLIDSDQRYILNDLYVNDYCVWIQHVPERYLASVATALDQIKLTKDDVKLDLADIEKEATAILKAQENGGVLEQFASLHLDPDSEQDQLVTDFDRLKTANEDVPKLITEI